jgi:hypothetical protein
MYQDMKKYEELFREFCEKITPITDKVTGFMADPVNKPHNLSYDLLQEMELLHMKLDTALYRLRIGEIQERLKIGEIDLGDYDRLTKELYEKGIPYTHF